MTIITKRFITVIFAAIALLIVGLLIEELLSIRSGSLFGHTQTGHVVGWIGLAAIFSVFVYSVKKRFDRKAGWPKAWFMVHQVAGIVGPLVILIHAGWHFHALVPLLTLIVLGIVVVSGVIGVAVHRKALSLLNSTRKELVSLGLSQADIEDRLYGLVSGEEIFRVWQIIHVPMVMLFLALVVLHVFGALYFGRS
jgi:cytochrome b561